MGARMIGRGLGEGIQQVLSRRGHVDELLIAAVVLSIILWVAWIFLKKKTPLDDSVDAAETGPSPDDQPKP